MAVSYLETWDIVAIALYFGLVLGAGLYAIYRSKKSTISGYFLAGRFMTWLPVGASLFASNIGSDHFIGLAGSGAAGGIGVGGFEFNALICLQILGWIFLPVFIASKVCTLPEYMSKRFGGKRIRIFLAVLSLVLYIFTKLSVNLYSGAIFVRETLGWNLYLSTLLILAITCACTITGGLTAVIYTDVLQFFVMIIGASILMFKSFAAVGGMDGLREKYPLAIAKDVLPNSTCGYPREDAWVLLRDPINSDMPWPGFLLGQTPASIWYWCADQMMVQRALAAKSISHAQGGTLFAGYMKILPMFLIVLPGMISRVLFPDVIGCSDPDVCEKFCGSRLGCSNLAYPKLVLEVMPNGIRGIMFAVMLAALMSDLTSVFNSASTLFTMDVWIFIRRRATTAELLLVGKLFVLFMVAVSIAWIPVILQMQGGQLFLYIQAISAYLAPPIAAVYLVAVFWLRLNEQGAFWSLIFGFCVGLIRMGLDFSFPEPVCGEEDTRPAIVGRVHYMYFALILFVITLLVAAVISYLTKPPEASQLIRTTYFTRFQTEDRQDENNYELTNHTSDLASPDSMQEKHKLEESHTNGDDSGIIMGFTNSTSSAEDPSQTETNSVPILKRVYFFFCGNDSAEKVAIENEAMRIHLQELSTLKQSPRAKIFLNVSLAFIVLVFVFMYVFFEVILPLV